MASITLKSKAFDISERSKGRLILIISLTCVFLFFYTASSKIQEHRMFLEGLSIVEVIGKYALYISWAVPASEIIVAALLIIPQTNKSGLYGFIIVMSIFTIYIISMLLWAKRLACSCGGAIEKLSWVQHVWFNLAFIMIAVFALWLKKSKTN